MSKTKRYLMAIIATFFSLFLTSIFGFENSIMTLRDYSMQLIGILTCFLVEYIYEKL